MPSPSATRRSNGGTVQSLDPVPPARHEPVTPSSCLAEASIAPDRAAYLNELVAVAQGGLRKLEFGRLQVPQDYKNLLWARVPEGLWWRDHMQNANVHSKVTDQTISFRMHVWSFPHDRLRNNAALDVLREEIEDDLHEALGPTARCNWRAAGPRGKNQVLEMATDGGVGGGKPRLDASWFVTTAEAWVNVMRRHEIRDLRARVLARVWDS